MPASSTLIIGAGPAGLAVAACLERQGVAATILEQGRQVASSWRGHYDRLHLHTDRARSGLPFVPLPRDYPRYPSRAQVIDYLDCYAGALRAGIRFGHQVTSARPDGGGWAVGTQDTVCHADHLVVATGYTREPYSPVWPGQDEYRGVRLHSSRYRNGRPFQGQRVLVIGFGNSAGEIAIDLHEHGARVDLAVRGPVNVIPRELFGIPILAIGTLQRRLPTRLADALNRPLLRAVVGDLTRYGLRPSRDGTLTRIWRDARIPLIDVGTIRLIKQGAIGVRPGIERFTRDGVVFTNGSERPYDAVVLGTGYRPRVSGFLQDAAAALDAEGTPVVSGGESPVPGLWFCGFHVSPVGMLREIGREAKAIGEAIARAPKVRAARD
jgi:cation diffusion facilitator CzcD-associated flavoprotein CzcO